MKKWGEKMRKNEKILEKMSWKKVENFEEEKSDNKLKKKGWRNK